jgi:hypothetical protein
VLSNVVYANIAKHHITLRIVVANYCSLSRCLRTSLVQHLSSRVLTIPGELLLLASSIHIHPSLQPPPHRHELTPMNDKRGSRRWVSSFRYFFLFFLYKLSTNAYLRIEYAKRLQEGLETTRLEPPVFLYVRNGSRTMRVKDTRTGTGTGRDSWEDSRRRSSRVPGTFFFPNSFHTYLQNGLRLRSPDTQAPHMTTPAMTTATKTLNTLDKRLQGMGPWRVMGLTMHLLYLVPTSELL